LDDATSPGAIVEFCCREEPCGSICISPILKKGADEEVAKGRRKYKSVTPTYTLPSLLHLLLMK